MYYIFLVMTTLLFLLWKGEEDASSKNTLKVATQNLRYNLRYNSLEI